MQEETHLLRYHFAGDAGDVWLSPLLVMLLAVANYTHSPPPSPPINLRLRRTPPAAITSSSLPPFHTPNNHSLDVSLGNEPAKAIAGAQPPPLLATSSRVSTLPPLFTTGPYWQTSWQQLPQLHHPFFPFNDRQHHHHFRRMPP
nr:hypothetical protein Iba_chr13cCG7890 [Ipomoea batatas]